MGQKYILTAFGKDRPGIVDLTSRRRFMAQSGAALYAMEIRVEVPKSVSLDGFDAGLTRVGETLNVDISW